MTTRRRGGCCSQPTEPRPLIDRSNLSSKNCRILRYHSTLSTPGTQHDGAVYDGNLTPRTCRLKASGCRIMVLPQLPKLVT